jgi:CTP:molybdopterin cytidylyltransferase MocA
MGCPKALMTVGNRPWWRLQEQRLAAAALPRIWVVSEPVAEELSKYAVRYVIANSDSPMFDSVKCGIDACNGASGVFILPVDVPAPGAAVLLALAAAADGTPAVPVLDGVRGHPVALPRPWINHVFLPACDQGIAHRLDRLIDPGVREVSVSDSAVAANLNTPAELQQWLLNV